jgi:hypothetical protein
VGSALRSYLVSFRLPVGILPAGWLLLAQAAERHGARVVGFTVSAAQKPYADRFAVPWGAVDIRLQDCVSHGLLPVRLFHLPLNGDRQR